MNEPIFISPRWLELLAQRMRNAGIGDFEINETEWVRRINDAINASPIKNGIDIEFGTIEIGLVRKRIDKLNVWESGDAVNEK